MLSGLLIITITTIIGGTLITINFEVSAIEINEMSNEQLAIEIKSGNKLLFDQLFNQVKDYIAWFANKHYFAYKSYCIKAGVEVDDLIQQGCLALYDAVEAFDQGSGYTLITYMNLHIKRRYNELFGIRTSKRDMLNFCVSLDAPIGDSDADGSLADMVPDSTSEDPYRQTEEEIFQQQLRQALDDCMQGLDEENRQVIVDRYWNGKTLSNIASERNISTEYVRQKEKGAFKHIRRPKNLKVLLPFKEEIISRYSYRGTGFSSYIYSQSSSVERTVENLERIMLNVRSE